MYVPLRWCPPSARWMSISCHTTHYATRIHRGVRSCQKGYATICLIRGESDNYFICKERLMLNQADRLIVRDLATRVAEIAALPEMAEKRALWKRHNSLQSTRPLVLVFPEGSWGNCCRSRVCAARSHGRGIWKWICACASILTSISPVIT